MARKKANYPLIEGLEITTLAAEGKAMGRYNDVVVFVPMTVPGDVVDVQIRHKNLVLTKKMDVITPKSLRERVLVYLSQESVKQGNRTVTVPFNRQQMADYLSVDRSALSGELSKMQKEGVIAYEKNRFTVL